VKNEWELYLNSPIRLQRTLSIIFHYEPRLLGADNSHQDSSHDAILTSCSGTSPPSKVTLYVWPFLPISTSQEPGRWTLYTIQQRGL